MRLEAPTITTAVADAPAHGVGPLGPAFVPVLAVTGASGKSTVAALVRSMLRGSGFRVHPTWAAARERIDRLSPRDRIVLDLGWPLPDVVPDLALLVVTGLAGDELPPDVAPAAAAEAVRHLARQATDGVLVNADDAQALAAATATRGPVRRASIDDRTADATVHDGEFVLTHAGVRRRAGRVDETALTTGALVSDLLVAGLAALASGARMSDVRRAACQYRPAADHFEVIGSIGHTTWVNDAAATRPGRTVAMLDRLDAPVVLVAGGRHGGQPLWRWARCTVARCAHVCLFGSAGAVLADAVVGAGGVDKVVRCTDLDDALHAALRLAVPGDTVVLSPGCLPEGDTPPGQRFRVSVQLWQAEREAA